MPTCVTSSEIVRMMAISISTSTTTQQIFYIVYQSTFWAALWCYFAFFSCYSASST